MYIDIIISLILILFTYFGYKKGIIAEFISFGALIFNIALSRQLNPYILDLLGVKEAENVIGNTIIYILSFIIIYIVLNFIVRFLLKTLKRNSNIILDSLIGGLFGFLKGCILSVLIISILIVLLNFNPKLENVIENSKTYAIAHKGIDLSKNLLPNDIKDTLVEYKKRVKEANLIKENLFKEN